MPFNPIALQIKDFRNYVNEILSEVLGIAESTNLDSLAIQGQANDYGVLVSFAASQNSTAKLGSGGKTIYTLLLKKDDTDAQPGIVLFYKSPVLDIEFTDLLDTSTVALNNLIKQQPDWFFYSNVERYWVHDDLTTGLLNLVDGTLSEILKDKVLGFGINIQKKASNPIPIGIDLPTGISIANTSLWLNLPPDFLVFSVPLTGAINNLFGTNLIFDNLEAGIIKTYKNESNSIIKYYLSGVARLFGFGASFTAILYNEDNGSKGMSFEIYPEDSIDVAGGLAKLGELMTAGTTLNIPDGINKINLGIKIEYLSGYFYFTDGLQNLSGKVSCNFGTDGWSPVGVSDLSNLFKLKSVGVEFSWQKDTPVNWNIMGEVIAEGFDVSASFAYPAQIISAQLSPSKEAPANIKTFLKDTICLPEDASKLVSGVLTAVDLSVYYNISDSEVEFSVRNSTPWYLIDNILSVKEMDLRINRTGGEFSYAELFLEIELPIGALDENKSRTGVSLNIDGIYDDSVWSFEGDIEQPIALGDFIGWLAQFGANENEIPDEIKNLYLEDLSISFTYSDGNTSFIFSGTLEFPLSDDKSLYLNLKVELSKNKTGWEVNFSTSVYYCGYEFMLQFAKQDNSGLLILASFTNENAEINLVSLLSEIVPEGVSSVIPELTIGVKDAFIGFYKPEKGYSVVLGLDMNIGLGLDLSEIPLIGSLLSGAEFGIKNLRIVGCINDLESKGLLAFNTLLQAKNIDDLQSPGDNIKEEEPFKEGFYISSAIIIPGRANGIPVHAEFIKEETKETKSDTEKSDNKTGEQGNHEDVSQVPATPPTKTGIKPVGKQIGPFFLDSVALGMEGGKIKLTFNGGIIAGPVGMQLIDFTMCTPFNKFDPEFDIQGISIGLDKSPISISGALMKNFHNDTNVNPNVYVKEYAGSVSIGFKAFTLVALGAYAEVTEQNSTFYSLFLYGFLGAPLGGPVFFIVTGLAAGFGFNRKLNIPDVEQIESFPLITVAKNPVGVALKADDLAKMLTNLKEGKFIPPSKGDYWFALGLRIDSFKMINTFMLITVQFGNEIEIDILGISTMQFPISLDPHIPSVIKIVIGLRAHIVPMRGIVEIKGVLMAGTFIYHPSVKLSGGFAMLAIMKDQLDGEKSGAKAGDFVITLGGYGPFYTPKPYYPVVPRLELKWSFSNDISIFANAYFAITPQAIMLGGHFELDVNIGGALTIFVHAAMGIDFIIYWQPMHYKARAYAELKVGAIIDILFINETISLDLGAEIEIWGPDFAGYASVDINFLISFTVTIQFGSSEQPPPLLKWQDFKDNFLQVETKNDKKILKGLSVTLAEGLLPGNNSIPSVNPKELKFIVNSVIPVKTSNFITENYSITEFGIKSMGLTTKLGQFNSEMTVTITKDTNVGWSTLNEVSQYFNVIPITKNMPSTLWEGAYDNSGDETKRPDNLRIDLVNDLLCGFEISARAPVYTGKIVTIDIAKDLKDALTGAPSKWEISKPPILAQRPSPVDNMNIVSSSTSEELNTLFNK